MATDWEGDHGEESPFSQRQNLRQGCIENRGGEMATDINSDHREEVVKKQTLAKTCDRGACGGSNSHLHSPRLVHQKVQALQVTVDDEGVGGVKDCDAHIHIHPQTQHTCAKQMTALSTEGTTSILLPRPTPHTLHPARNTHMPCPWLHPMPSSSARARVAGCPGCAAGQTDCPAHRTQ